MDAYQYPELGKATAKLAQFTNMMESLRALTGELSLPNFYEEVMARTGYAAALEQKNDLESRSRLENIRELLTSINGYLENQPDKPSLAGFLDEIALYTDIDAHDAGEDSVVMMTMHAAKGLEFPVVFVVGTEEGIFPGVRAIGEHEEMEEERRLCYVAMTRAKERLHMTCAAQRMLFGKTSANRPSRFVGEIPVALVEKSGRNVMSVPTEDESEPWEYRRSGFAQNRVMPYTSRQNNGGFGVSQRERPSRPSGVQGGYTPRTSPAKSGSLPDFRKGDMLTHKAFGKGMVLSVQPMGGDALIEIAFDTVGTKKLMLKSAAQHMTKL